MDKYLVVIHIMEHHTPSKMNTPELYSIRMNFINVMLAKEARQNICTLPTLKALQDNREGQICTKTISVWGRKCSNRHV